MTVAAIAPSPLETTMNFGDLLMRVMGDLSLANLANEPALDFAVAAFPTQARYGMAYAEDKLEVYLAIQMPDKGGKYMLTLREGETFSVRRLSNNDSDRETIAEGDIGDPTKFHEKLEATVLPLMVQNGDDK